MVRRGDVLLTKDGTIGKVAIVRELPGPAALNSHLYLIRPADDRLVPAFLYHVLQSERFRSFANLNATGSTINGLPWKTFRCFGIPVPPIGEQRKIAAVLSSVDEAIDKTQAVIDQLGVVKKAMMQELLTKGLPGRHTRFKQTEIGMVPEEWEVRSIESLLESCTYGVNCPLSADPLSGTPVLRMSNLQNDRLDLSDLKYADLAALPHDKTELRRGDLLFNRTNSADLVGKVALVDTDRTLSYASYLLRLRTLPSVASTSWLFHRMAAPDLQEELRSIATKGVSQSNINPTKMRAIIVAVPPPDEQAEIVRTLDCLGARAEAEADCLQQSRALKSALMSVLLTGEVRVTPDEDAA